MKYCYKCGAQISDDFDFCHKCGKQQPQIPAEAVIKEPKAPEQPACVPVQQPVPQEPVQQPVMQAPLQQSAPQYISQAPTQNIPQPTYQVPVYAQPVYPPQPPAAKPGTFQGKAGLGLGIAALVTGVISLAGYILLLLEANFSDYFEGISADGVPIILGVIGLILSCVARKRNNRTKKTLIGMIFSIIGIVLGVMGVIVALYLSLYGNLASFLPDNMI